MNFSTACKKAALAVFALLPFFAISQKIISTDQLYADQVTVSENLYVLGIADFDSTTQIIVKGGPQSGRPGSPDNYSLYFNTDSLYLEVYYNGVWYGSSGGGGGSGIDNFDFSNVEPSAINKIWVNTSETDSLPSIYDARVKTYTRLKPGVFLKDFGAVGDGSTDDRTALDNAFAFLDTANVKRLYIDEGTYRISSRILENGWADDIEIIGIGHATIKGDTSIFSLNAANTNAELRADVSIGNDTLRVVSGSWSFTPQIGDLVRINSTETVETNWSTKETDIHEVAAVLDDSTLILDSKLMFDYTPATDTATAQLLRPFKATIKNITFETAETSGGSLVGYNSISFIGAKELILSNCKWIDEADRRNTSINGVSIARSKDVLIVNPIFDGVYYGALVNATRNFTATNITANRVRHAVSPATWSYNVSIRGLNGTGCISCMDSHASFYVSYSDVHCVNERDYMNIRGTGVYANRIYIEPGDNNTQQYTYITLPGGTVESYYNNYILGFDIYLNDFEFVVTSSDAREFNGISIASIDGTAFINDVKTHSLAAGHAGGSGKVFVNNSHIGNFNSRVGSYTINNTKFDGSIAGDEDYVIYQPTTPDPEGSTNIVSNSEIFGFDPTQATLLRRIVNRNGRLTFSNVKIDSIKALVNTFVTSPSDPNYLYRGIDFQNTQIEYMADTIPYQLDHQQNTSFGNWWKDVAGVEYDTRAFQVGEGLERSQTGLLYGYSAKIDTNELKTSMQKAIGRGQFYTLTICNSIGVGVDTATAVYDTLHNLHAHRNQAGTSFYETAIADSSGYGYTNIPYFFLNQSNNRYPRRNNPIYEALYRMAENDGNTDFYLAYFGRGGTTAHSIITDYNSEFDNFADSLAAANDKPLDIVNFQFGPGEKTDSLQIALDTIVSFLEGKGLVDEKTLYLLPTYNGTTIATTSAMMGYSSGKPNFRTVKGFEVLEKFDGVHYSQAANVKGGKLIKEAIEAGFTNEQSDTTYNVSWLNSGKPIIGASYWLALKNAIKDDVDSLNYAWLFSPTTELNLNNYIHDVMLFGDNNYTSTNISNWDTSMVFGLHNNVGGQPIRSDVFIFGIGNSFTQKSSIFGTNNTITHSDIFAIGNDWTSTRNQEVFLGEVTTDYFTVGTVTFKVDPTGLSAGDIWEYNASGYFETAPSGSGGGGSGGAEVLANYYSDSISTAAIDTMISLYIDSTDFGTNGVIDLELFFELYNASGSNDRITFIVNLNGTNLYSGNGNVFGSGGTDSINHIVRLKLQHQGAPGNQLLTGSYMGGGSGPTGAGAGAISSDEINSNGAIFGESSVTVSETKIPLFIIADWNTGSNVRVTVKSFTAIKTQ